MWGCRWRRPLPSSSSGRSVRVAAALVYPSFFSISVSNPLSSFVLSRLQPYPAPRRSPSFLVFDRPRAYIHERAVVFSENFGGPALRPRARRSGACLRGIAPGSRRIFGGPAARPRSIVGRGGLRTCSQHVHPFFCLSSSPRRSPSFLVFDRPGAHIHERALFFSENFGGPALRPRARRSGTCLGGIAPRSCCIFGGPSARSCHKVRVAPATTKQGGLWM